MPEVTGTLSQEVKIDLDDALIIDQTARARVEELAELVANLPEADDELTQRRLTKLETDATALKSQVDSLSGASLHTRIADLETRLAAYDAMNLPANLRLYADRLLALESRPSGGTQGDSFGENAILVDTMPGADDGARIDAAWELNRVTGRPIRFSARVYTDRTGASRKKHSSLRLRGPNDGWQNPEQAAAGGKAECQVICNSGLGNAAWIVGDRTTYNFQVQGIYFKSSNGNTQWMHHPFGGGWTCYASEYSDIAFYGFKHAIGRPGDAASLTLASWTGQWSHVAVLGTQSSVRGSDCFFDAHINHGWAGANGGQYLMRFENMSKTVVKHLYLTARGGSRAVLVQGTASNQGGLMISHCVIEGQNLNDPAMGALIVVEGGGVSFKDIAFNFGMARPSDFADRTDIAFAMVTGGTAVFDTLWVNRANQPGTSTPVDVPIVSYSGSARGSVKGVWGMQSWSGLPKVKVTSSGYVETDGTVQRVA